jgi:hypothetical protein
MVKIFFANGHEGECDWKKSQDWLGKISHAILTKV